jgi:hypothetical protein
MMELWVGTRMNDKWSIIHMDLHKPNNKLVSVATPFLEECEDDTHIPEMGT